METTRIILERELVRWEHLRNDIKGTLAIIEGIIKGLKKEINNEAC